jgi:hypothetical protein
VRRAYLFVGGWALGLGLLAYLWAVRPALAFAAWLDDIGAGRREHR